MILVSVVDVQLWALGAALGAAVTWDSRIPTEARARPRGAAAARRGYAALSQAEEDAEAEASARYSAALSEARED